MIKEIKEISQEMIKLNSQVYGTILSKKDLKKIKEALIGIQLNQNNINKLLQEASFTSTSNPNELITIITNIHQSLYQLGIFTEKIYTLLDKFVCNYREEWNITKINQA
ncbi:MAG TPA: lipoate protein ligase C-terminal domain-containing protein [Candidatus Babeliales bacterium]|nr:lipoate protein ligase C-terminal domain-containing protein [Candidatus Babeliales bacterium]